MPDKLLPITFPIGGLVENTASAAQPPNTTPDCLNVRPYDAFERRLRGGQRTGIEKYLENQVNGSAAIQRLTTLVEALDPTNLIVDTQLVNETFETYTVGTELDGQGGWDVYFDSNGTARRYFQVDDDGTNAVLTVRAGKEVESSSNGPVTAIRDTAPTLGSAWIMSMDARMADPGSTPDNGCGFAFVFRVDNNDFTDGYYALEILTKSGTETTQYEVTLRKYTTDTSSSSTSEGTTTVTVTNTRTNNNFKIQVVGEDMTFFVNDIQRASYDLDNHKSDHFGLGFARTQNNGAAGTETQAFIDNVSIAKAKFPAILRSTRLIAVAGGTIKTGVPPAVLSTPTNGGSAVSSAGLVDAVSAFSDTFFCDGKSANYVYFDAADEEVKDWATDVTGGSLPAGSVDTAKGCSIIALYRGRIVMSGLAEEPQNWFMSKSGDPFDWNYSPSTTSPIQAVAGNNSNVGELGDILTALAPYQDDIMLMGGARSLWVMRGDPAAGGAIDNISRQVGIIGPDAWTWDTGGNFYFFGDNGLYRLASGAGTPELLSQGKLDKTFADLDIATNRVRLEYDAKWHGVHIFITPVDEPTTGATNYWWDERTNSFWADQYPTEIGPTATLRFNADDPDQSALLIGGFDGYIRKFADAATNDDGTAIASHVVFPPIQPGDVVASGRIDDVQMVLDSQSDDVTLEYYPDSSPEAAVTAAIAGTSPRVSRTLKGGRNSYIRHRIAQNAIVFRLEQTLLDTRWAFEQGMARIKVLNRMRGRRV